jgi:hypothetical protein
VLPDAFGAAAAGDAGVAGLVGAVAAAALEAGAHFLPASISASIRAIVSHALCWPSVPRRSQREVRRPSPSTNSAAKPGLSSQRSSRKTAASVRRDPGVVVRQLGQGQSGWPGSSGVVASVPRPRGQTSPALRRRRSRRVRRAPAALALALFLRATRSTDAPNTLESVGCERPATAGTHLSRIGGRRVVRSTLGGFPRLGRRASGRGGEASVRADRGRWP